jgi:hypothetical protein
MTPKDFQEATAERILEIFKHKNQNRILLADEVGLGKTIIANAVVKKVSEWHQKELHDDHFKVIYVCSNISIANQNYQKLGVRDEDCFNISESRLSMQHLKIYQNAGRDHSYQQLIPLTPATSFTMTGGQGIKSERALMNPFLRRFRGLSAYPETLSQFLRFEKGLKGWELSINEYEQRVVECDADTGCYIHDILEKLDTLIPDELYREILNICSSGHVFQIKSAKRRDIINALRRIFAQISLNKLEPDLVIMDEFQRFKDLISPRDDESGMLSKRFLSDTNTKVLLLSATPYKPYSTLEELANEDGGHYEEFMQVMDFLLYNSERNTTFHQVWTDYSCHLNELTTNDLTALIAQKNVAEDSLYQCVCRTERMNFSMIDTSKATEIKITPEDILSYVEMQQLLDRLGLGNFPIEYVKSAPYLLSFMNYKIKDRIVDRLKKSGDYSDVENSKTMLLRTRQINNYRQIGCNNARLQLLFDQVFDHGKNGAELLLWIPAAKPYYETKSIFNQNTGYSKLLVFSSWEMVPRMIASFASYEAERLTIGKLAKRQGQKVRKYFADENKKRSATVRLRNETEELIKYPSRTLAALFNPLAFAGGSIFQIRRELKSIIQEKIDDVSEMYGLQVGRGGAGQLLELLKAIGGKDRHGSLKVITNDAADLFSNMAIGSPGICAYRIFHNEKSASEIGNCFVSLFNKQESMAVVDVLYGKGEEFYYEAVIRYCAEGNLQAVLDEYAYVIGKSGNQLLEAMKAGFVDTASVQIETQESLVRHTVRPRLRTHFAVGYFNAKISEKSVQRTENIRAAFNSPFRPFVLATTSIGQEGLDFHSYSRKIMHWNLPSNPVDLEQREGRINRYLCHAIRQNIAFSEYGNFPFSKTVWPEMFDRAAHDMKGNHSDLIPYWCLPKGFNFSHKIERIVPMYPYSQDRFRYDKLIEVLSLYRLTLGQPRQEELFEVIEKREWEKGTINELYLNLSPFERQNRNKLVLSTCGEGK